MAKLLDTAIGATLKPVDFEYDPGQSCTATLRLISRLFAAFIIFLIACSPPRSSHFAIGLAIKAIVNVMRRVVRANHITQFLHVGLVALASCCFARVLVISTHYSICAVGHAVGG